MLPLPAGREAISDSGLPHGLGGATSKKWLDFQ